MHEPVLHVDRPFPIDRHFMIVSPVRPHHVSKLVITQVEIQDVLADVSNMFGFSNREQEFHPAIEIALHEICRAQINLFLPTIEKVINSTMFQKPSDNTGHVNVFAESPEYRVADYTYLSRTNQRELLPVTPHRVN